MFEGKPAAAASLIRRSHPRNGSPKDIELEIFELGAGLECGLTNKLKFFVADDAFEGGTTAERHLFDDCELIGESDTREGEALTE